MKNFVFLTIMCIFAVTKAFAQTQTENYVMTETMLDASGNKKITSVQYYDGLGRPSLAVQNGINNSSSVSNYTLQEYDGCGRESKSWLPIAGSGLGYNPNITSSASDSKAYSQTTYDALGRPVFVSTPGSDMNGKGKTIEYTTNAANSVKRYKISGANVLSQDGYYPACSLTGEKTTDEDGHTIEVFKNLLGNVVLERRASSGKYDTYYVYNDLQQLAFVLQPMYQQTPNANLYSFQYTYDSKGRMATKRLPGCGTCYYSYDNADRMISSKDGNGVIHFYLYDGLGRQVLQGTCSNMFANDKPYANLDFVLNSSAFLGTGYLLPNDYQLNNAELEIASYYDSYSFLNSAIVANSSTLNALTKADAVCAASFPTGNITMASDGTRLFSAYYYDIKGNVTQQYETMLDGVVMKTETTYSFTDKPTEVVTTLIKNGASYVLTEENNYYANCDKPSYTAITYNGASEETASLYYDNYGRIYRKEASDGYYTTDFFYNIRNALTCIDAYDYYSEDIFSENLYYANVQNPNTDTPCFNGNISSFIWKSAYDNVYRKYNFEYDGLDHLLNSYYSEGNTFSNLSQNNKYKERIQYDANSSPTLIFRFGRTNNGTYQSVDDLKYTYDGNHLQSIRDISGSLVYSYSYDFKDKANATTEYLYDDNGNMTMDLNSNIGLIQYDSQNHPKRIQFTDGNNIQYAYSADGTKLSVTHQAAVDNITVAAGNTLDLTSSTLRSQVVNKYYGRFQFCNNSLERILFDGGYISFEYGEEEPCYHYYFTDHLGSVRVSADNTYAIDQVNHYYPYGGLIGNLSYEEGFQSYKYNGKEMDRMYGLDWLDYGARMYNPAVGLWTQMDPLAEKYYHINPYLYCAGNPIRFIDPDGRRPGDYITEKGELINNDGVNDGRLYVLKTTQKNGFDSYGGAKGAGIDKKTKKSVIKNKDISNNDNFVEVIGPQELRQAVAGKIRDDGNGETKSDNNREYGITFEKNVDSPTLYTKESPVGDPTTDANISLSMGNNPEVTYVHSHPSGTKYNYKTHKSSRWMQAPSLPDVQNAGQATQYVIGCGDKTVYMYNNQGILATLPLNIFINYQVKR